MNTQAMSKLILTRKDLKRLGIEQANTTLLRWEATGQFPRRLRLSGTSIVWLASDIAAWLSDRVKERAHYAYVVPALSDKTRAVNQSK